MTGPLTNLRNRAGLIRASRGDLVADDRAAGANIAVDSRH